MIHFVRFNIIGLISAFVGYTTVFLAMGVFGLSPFLSNLMGYGLGLTTSFSLNRYFNFKTGRKTSQAVCLLLPVTGFAYLSNLAVLWGSTHVLQLNPYLAQLAGGGAYTLLSYFCYKFIVFGNQQKIART